MKTKQTILYGILVVLISLAFIACDNGSGPGNNPNNNNGANAGTEGNGTDPGTGGNGNGNGGGGTTVPGNTLAAKLAWLSSNAISDTTYTLEVTADESIAQQTLYYANKSGITIILKGTGTERIISFSDGGGFSVWSGVTLVLDNNITLKGSGNNPHAAIVSGVLEMRAGSKITGYSDGVFVYGTFTMNGGTITGNTGNGVFVDRGGTFTMNGGEISGNTASGVYVYNGTFTMNGGEISGSIAGVSIFTLSTFTMNGGKISGNGSVSGGHGVFMGGTFTMNGGEISGNTDDLVCGGVVVDGENATFTMNNGKISGNTTRLGIGGVYVVYGTFTMNGGEISGNTATGTINGYLSCGGVGVRGTSRLPGTFRIVTGTIYGSNEGALSNTGATAAALWLNMSGTAQQSSGTAQRGTFSGEMWISKGNLSSTNNTIRVLNGELQ